MVMRRRTQEVCVLRPALGMPTEERAVARRDLLGKHATLVALPMCFSPGGRRPQRAECSLHTRSLATVNVRPCPTTVETCSGRFILLSFHETRARKSLSLSLSSHRLAKQNVAPSDGCFPSPALPPRRKGAGHAVRTALGRAGCSTLLMRSYLLCLTRVRVYTPQTGGGQPVDPRTWSLRDFPESLAEGIDIPLCASGPQPRQFGGVCLTSEHRHHAIPSYIT